MKKRYFKLKIDLYKVVIHFSFGQTDEEFKKDILDALSSIISQEDTKLVSTMVGSGYTMIHKSGHLICRCAEIPSNPYYKGVLSHEIFHLVDFIMEKVGIKLSRNSGEAFSYLTEYITKAVYRKL